MSTENSEFAVPEVVADEKEVTKEIKGTKRPSEVSILPSTYKLNLGVLSVPNIPQRLFVFVQTAPHEFYLFVVVVYECACVFFC